MAIEAQVPIIPVIVWGAHRIWTKDHPKNLGRSKIPITVAIGPPMDPEPDVNRTMRELRTAMQTQLYEAQETYPRPAGEYWVPHRLGGGAPSPERARELDGREAAERTRRHRDRSGRR